MQQVSGAGAERFLEAVFRVSAARAQSHAQSKNSCKEAAFRLYQPEVLCFPKFGGCLKISLKLIPPWDDIGENQ